MHRVRVKIEGLRDPAEASEIARLGADAIGLVFADSPRKVSVEQARAVVAALPPWVAAVGVFVNADAEEINRVVARTGVGCVQLHGDEGADLPGRIDTPCVKAFRVRDEGWLGQVRSWVAGAARDRLTGVLLDAYSPAARGGTGSRFNWDLVARARDAGELDGLPPIILAGGLDASCVGRAIQTVRPWAVDVASGVESAPGVKDLRKVADFLRAVRRAENPDGDPPA